MALTYFWDVDSRPEKFKMFPHPLRFVFAVKDGEFGEHAHMRSFESESSLEKVDEFLEVAAVLVVVDEVLELVGVHDDVQAAHLRQAELAAVHARETHLFPGASRVRFAGAVHCPLELLQVHQSDRQTSKVWHIVVQQFCSVVHLVIKTTVSDLIKIKIAIILLFYLLFYKIRTLVCRIIFIF